MILLDTDVVSEPMRALPDPRVIAWIADGYIAAIAATHGLAVATRDTGPFEAAGATVIDPWLS